MRLADRLLAGLGPGLDHQALRERASALMRPRLAYDLAVWAVIDPATLMWTSCVLDGAERDERLEAEVFANEYGADDVLKLTALADGPRIASLRGATAGDPMASARYRDTLHPRGYRDEMRMVFHDGETAWGALVLLRADPFRDAEVAEVSALNKPFARMLRSALLRTGAPAPAAPAGLVLARPDGTILEVNDDARALLGGTDLPQAVQALVARRSAGLSASAALPTVAGRWLAFHATPLGGSLAVVVESIQPHRMSEIVVRGRGLTARERDVLALVARGHANRTIARELRLSEYTVQDHLKAIFAKFGVASRNELVAALFFDHYAPLHAADGPGRA